MLSTTCTHMLHVSGESSAAATASAIPIQCGRVASRGLAFIGVMKLVVVNIEELLIIRIGHGVAGRPSRSRPSCFSRAFVSVPNRERERQRPATRYVHVYRVCV